MFDEQLLDAVATSKIAPTALESLRPHHARALHPTLLRLSQILVAANAQTPLGVEHHPSWTSTRLSQREGATRGDQPLAKGASSNLKSKIAGVIRRKMTSASLHMKSLRKPTKSTSKNWTSLLLSTTVVG